jgi:hypothetical protein
MPGHRPGTERVARPLKVADHHGPTPRKAERDQRKLLLGAGAQRIRRIALVTKAVNGRLIRQQRPRPPEVRHERHHHRRRHRHRPPGRVGRPGQRLPRPHRHRNPQPGHRDRPRPQQCPRVGRLKPSRRHIKRILCRRDNRLRRSGPAHHPRSDHSSQQSQGKNTSAHRTLQVRRQ